MEDHESEEEEQTSSSSQVPTTVTRTGKLKGLSQQEMEELELTMGGDSERVRKVKDIKLQYERLQEGITVPWEDLLSDVSQEPEPCRNFEKSPSKSKKPTKSFIEMVKEEDAKEKARMRIGDTGRTKTMDDFEYKAPTSRKQQYYKFPVMVWLALVVVGFGAGIAWYFNYADVPSSSSSNPERRGWDYAHKKLLSEIQHLSKAFPSQRKDTLLHILSAINSTLALQQPKQPSSLMLLVPPSLSRSPFPQCFTQKLAKLTNNIFSEMNATIAPSVFEIDSKYFEKYGQDITLIHSQLHHYFGSGGRSIVVKDVEKIELEKYLLLFHGLCDNFHAPEKRATLFFIVPVPQEKFIPEKWNNERASDLSYEILDNAWKSTTNDDSRPAIISRVAASVVLLNNGDNCT